MNKYESVFIVNSTLDIDTQTAIIEKFKTLIEGSATEVSVKDIGKKRLAYPIQDYVEARYVYVNFTSNPDFPAELERVFKITDGILRFLTVRVDE